MKFLLGMAAMAALIAILANTTPKTEEFHCVNKPQYELSCYPSKIVYARDDFSYTCTCAKTIKVEDE